GALDSLYEKYYSNIGVYDENNNTLTKNAIKCVNAVHPFGDKPLSKWPSHLPKITPDVSSVLLLDETDGFDKILNLINETA
ncbi:MAG: hypothetical protein J6N72_03935, partial [Psychrobacter sp.]|nr:hypothetical protein [Psychrobacter sp.]